MTPIIILDSSPLGLQFQKLGFPVADACRHWIQRQMVAGARIVVPEVINYELHRELLRLGKAQAVAALAAFNAAVPDRFLPLTTPAMDLAAELWAAARRRGRPTTSHEAIDIDVILAALVLAAGYPPGDFVVATSNVAHLRPADRRRRPLAPRRRDGDRTVRRRRPPRRRPAHGVRLQVRRHRQHPHGRRAGHPLTSCP